MKYFTRFMKIAIPVIIITLFIFPAGRELIFKTAGLFSTIDPGPIKDYIRSFGTLAVVISFLLMVFQSIVAPLPAFLITFANAAVFGWVWGALLSWSSAMAGAAVCFGIARLYGRNVVIKLSGKTALVSVEDFFERHGGNAILIARLLPFISFDIVSYGAGLTSMRFWPFFIATGIGQLPATLIYSYAGQMLGGGAKKFVFGLLMLFAIAALVYLLRSIFKEKPDTGEVLSVVEGD
jgi:uncharacterized membrane protein YdjX (TVP38/TMEM64 family)